MKLGKKIISVVIIISILIIPFWQQPKHVYASGFDMPFTITGEDGGLGTTLGALFTILVSIGLVNDGVKTDLKPVINAETGELIYIDKETQIALLEDINTNSSEKFLDKLVWLGDSTVNGWEKFKTGTANIWEFFFPKDTIIEIDENNLYLFNQFLIEYYGNPDISPGIYSSTEYILQRILTEKYNNKWELQSTEHFKYEYIAITHGYVDTGYYSYSWPRILSSNKPFNEWEYYSTPSSSYARYFRAILTEPIKITHLQPLYDNNQINNSNIVYREYTQDSFDDGNIFYQPFVNSNKNTAESFFNGILYCNYDLVIDGNIRYADPSEIVFEVSDLTFENSIDDGISIEITNDLITAGQNINIGDLTNTDELIGAISGTGALNNPLVDNTDDDIITGFPPLDVILNGLKDLFRWLFVPSSLALEDAITHCKETMNNNASILTFPLTLVIEFLLAVADLDTGQECIISIPPMQYKNHVLYSGSEFNITKFINENGFSTIQNIIYYIGNFMMILGIVNMAKNKGDEMLTGGLK